MAMTVANSNSENGSKDGVDGDDDVDDNGCGGQSINIICPICLFSRRVVTVNGQWSL